LCTNAAFVSIGTDGTYNYHFCLQAKKRSPPLRLAETCNSHCFAKDERYVQSNAKDRALALGYSPETAINTFLTQCHCEK